MISTCKLFEGVLTNPIVRNAVKQAAIWGASSTLSSKYGSSKPQSIEEKKKQKKNMLVGGLLGGAAGAIGSVV